MKKTAIPANHAQHNAGCGSRIQTTGVSPRMASRNVAADTGDGRQDDEADEMSSLREAASVPADGEDDDAGIIEDLEQDRLQAQRLRAD